MRKLTYFAVFEPSQDGGYGVYFPDVLGCISYGKDFYEAERMAREALGQHIYEMEKDGEELPVPNAPDKLDIFEETIAGYLISAITIFPDLVRNELDSRKESVNCTLPHWVKEAGVENKVNFSKLLEEAVMDYLKIGV